MNGSYVKHGMTHHPLFKSWSMMMSRCHNPNYTQFKDYGGRGVTVCERWQAVENFVSDMESTWFEGATLERKKVGNGYDAENCKWIPKAEQNLNTRRTVWVDWADGSREPVSVVARRIGVCDQTAYYRLRKGLPLQVVFCPSRLIKAACALAMCLIIASCTYTDKNRNIAFGGKGAARGTGYAVAWDNIENMNNALIAGTVLGGGLISAGVSKAEEVTKRTSIHSGERVTIGAQGVEQFKAGEETKRFLHSTPNPNELPK